MYCHICSTGFSSGARDGRKISVMFLGTLRLPVVCQPARSRSSTAWLLLATVRDISVEVKLHGVSVGEGQRQARADAAHRADGAKQISALVTLIGGLRRPCSAPRPLAKAAVLLADARLVLEPDLDGSVAHYAAEMGRENAGEVFWKPAWFCHPCSGSPGGR